MLPETEEDVFLMNHVGTNRIIEPETIGGGRKLKMAAGYTIFSVWCVETLLCPLAGLIDSNAGVKSTCCQSCVCLWYGIINPTSAQLQLKKCVLNYFVN